MKNLSMEMYVLPGVNLAHLKNFLLSITKKKWSPK